MSDVPVCLITHFAHPQQPKHQNNWKIRDPGMVWTWGSSRNMCCSGADVV